MSRTTYTLGAWGRGADGTFTAPVYESGTNACVCWVTVEPMELKSVKLWRARAAREMGSGGEHIMTALKDTVSKARAHAERWVQELTTEVVTA